MHVSSTPTLPSARYFRVSNGPRHFDEQSSRGIGGDPARLRDLMKAASTVRAHGEEILTLQVSALRVAICRKQDRVTLRFQPEKPDAASRGPNGCSATADLRRFTGIESRELRGMTTETVHGEDLAILGRVRSRDVRRRRKQRAFAARGDSPTRVAGVVALEVGELEEIRDTRDRIVTGAEIERKQFQGRLPADAGGRDPSTVAGNRERTQRSLGAFCNVEA